MLFCHAGEKVQTKYELWGGPRFFVNCIIRFSPLSTTLISIKDLKYLWFGRIVWFFLLVRTMRVRKTKQFSCVLVFLLRPRGTCGLFISINCWQSQAASCHFLSVRQWKLLALKRALTSHSNLLFHYDIFGGQAPRMLHPPLHNVQEMMYWKTLKKNSLQSGS